ncbi:protein RICE SALT SENSITIVE 3-like [Nymphaea colorata]|nr:protein RICE SALT SENSITIVE 3-like [Nymphaea colorata]
MDEEKFVVSPFSAAHLLQQSLRSICTQGNSDWIYAVFWRILPRYYPPPKWDEDGGSHRMSRGSQRNWILVWEDGFCNFSSGMTKSSSLEPRLFFRMAHEIYNLEDGLIGRVAANNSEKWIFCDLRHNLADSLPRSWEAQFQAGIQTIALVSVGGGVLQLGSLSKVLEDSDFISRIRRSLIYLQSIPGVLLPHPPSLSYATGTAPLVSLPIENQLHSYSGIFRNIPSEHTSFAAQDHEILPSMNSLEALLSKLPSVGQPSSSTSAPSHGCVEKAVEFIHEDQDGHYSMGELNNSWGP